MGCLVTLLAQNALIISWGLWCHQRQAWSRTNKII